MNFEVFDGAKRDETIRLQLVEIGSKVELCAVDSEGVRLSAGSLLTLDPEKGVVLHSSIGKEYGLPLDSSRHLQVVKE